MRWSLKESCSRWKFDFTLVGHWWCASRQLDCTHIFIFTLTYLSFNYSLLTILQQNTQRTHSCPRFGTRALIGGRRSVSVSTKSYRRWQRQLELLRRNILELTKSEDTGPGLDDQVKQEPLGIMIFWKCGFQVRVLCFRVPASNNRALEQHGDVLPFPQVPLEHRTLMR